MVKLDALVPWSIAFLLHLSSYLFHFNLVSTTISISALSNIIKINTLSVVSKLNNPRGFDTQLLHFITWAIRILAIYHIKFLVPLPGIALILLILIPSNLNCNLTFYFSCFNFFLLPCRFMRHCKSSDLVPLDKELRTLCRLNKEKKGTSTLQQQADMEEEAAEMEQPRALWDYAMPSVIGNTSSIRRPAIQANNFEIKPAII